MSQVSSTFKDLADEALMGLICQGEKRALNELYSRYSKPMLYYFYRMLGQSKEKSQDFLQDLFLKVIEKPELFDQKRKFSTWLYSVAHNMCKNEYRRMEVRKNVQNGEVIEVNGHTNLDNEIHIKLFADRLYGELDNLDEDRKTAFLLKYREGFSTKEISKVIGCNEGTVKSRLFYTCKKLSENLQAFNPRHDK